MMNSEKFTSYTIQWKQEYLGWQAMIDQSLEYQVESSEYKEANELIERIKNGNISKT